ncbi:MAG: acyl-CoA dehydrogenase family protein [Bacteriovoracaceae bacterium]|nr:acyl-CoA dehydrogenase family protein [Bacteriovoracaceae bacterium]
MNGEEKAMQVAESSREEWAKTSFLKEMFMGNFAYDLIHPFPEKKGMENEPFLDFLSQYRQFLTNEVDADQIDREGKIPPQIIDRLREMRVFALKIDEKYGGHGFTQSEYNEILKLTATKDSNLVALISAHQSIGVPQPLIMFGTEEQKQKYLPRFAKGEISAFALTETNVGSDPAHLETTIETKIDHYVLNGEKLWCTNGTIANVIIVMARHEEDDQISAFIVEMDWPGVKVEHRCHFMGLRALENGVISFNNVKVPRENLLWQRGKGLKLALMTLNTGRLSLPAAIAGASKKHLEIARTWCGEREQWGKPIYQHEAIAHKLSDLAANTFAIESISDLATALYDNNYDIRLEAAVAKLYCSETGWKNVDDLLQMRGGRGYETADSLLARGEPAIPVERIMRDFRINRIFEGTSEIMHLYIAREAVDKHLKTSGVLLDKNVKTSKKLLALPRIFFFYFFWYIGLWFTLPFGGGHLGYIKRSTKKLARQIFYGMIIHGPALQYKQQFLFRVVDIATELYVMAATISKSKQVHDSEDLAELFCQNSRRKVDMLFEELWNNSDKLKYDLAQRIEDDEFFWLEQGIIKDRPVWLIKNHYDEDWKTIH